MSKERWVTHVRFKWIDSDRTDGWNDTDEDEELDSDFCIASGLLISENKDYIKLAVSLSPEQHLSPLTVPKFAIVGKIKREKERVRLKK